jgi:hypothetical protein
MLRIELATLFARAKISELDAQITPAPSSHYSASSTGSGLTSDEFNAPQDSTEMTYTHLSVSTNLNITFQHVFFLTEFVQGRVSKCIHTCKTEIKYILMFQRYILFWYII